MIKQRLTTLVVCLSLSVLGLSALNLSASAAYGEQLPSLFGEYGGELSRVPAVTSFQASPTADPAVSMAEERTGKSPRKAFFLSVLFPGAGELYAGAKVRAAVFFALEVAGLGAYLSWNGEGNDIEDEFRSRADSSWVPGDYLAWRNSTISRNSSITHALPCSTDIVENSSVGGGGLPVSQLLKGCGGTEVQQYYELIGKYDQFVAGWKDLEQIESGSPTLPTQVDSVEKYQSETRFDYEVQRDDSNRYLKRASSVTGLLLVNHVISAIDAARVARARAEGVDEAVLDRRTRFMFSLYPGSRSQVPMVTAYKPFR
jgi:hypothetical protein